MKQKLIDLYNTLNKKYYTLSFIIGTFILILGIFTITFLPLIIKSIYKPIDNNFYRTIEFILLFISSVLYVFSYRHFKNQLVIISFIILFYIAFVKFYIFFI